MLAGGDPDEMDDPGLLSPEDGLIPEDDMYAAIEAELEASPFVRRAPPPPAPSGE